MKYSEPVFTDNQSALRQSSIGLINGRVFDVIRGRYFPEGTILVIKDGLIDDLIEPGKQQENVKLDYAIDLKNRAVLPSLFNTHCHISITSPSFIPSFKYLFGRKKLEAAQLEVNMAECLARGITNIREAYLEDMRIIGDLKKRIRTGQLAGPRIYQSVVVGPPGSYMAEKYDFVSKLMGSAMGAGQSEHSKSYAGVLEFPVDASEQQVRESVDRAIEERGAQTIKIGDQRVNVMDPKKSTLLMTAKQLGALADQAHKRGIPTMMHHLSLESFRRGVEAKVTSLSHTPVDGVVSNEDIQALKAARCIIEPTCSAAYAVSWKVKDSEWAKSLDIQLLESFRNKRYTFSNLAEEYFLPELRKPLIDGSEMLSQGKFKMFGVDSSNMFRYYASFVCLFENVRMLFKNGATIALANDAGIPPLAPSMMKLELDLLRLIINGMSGEGALSGTDLIRIATINSAKSMGLDHLFGSVEKGKVADLIVVDGDPATNSELLGQRVSALFMDGELRINNKGLTVRPADAGV